MKISYLHEEMKLLQSQSFQVDIRSLHCGLFNSYPSLGIELNFQLQWTFQYNPLHKLGALQQDECSIGLKRLLCLVIYQEGRQEKLTFLWI